jgi:hypothetical protein
MTTQVPTVRALLVETKRIIATRETWTQHTAARNERGAIVSIESPRACKFCVNGAVEKARRSLDLPRDSHTEVAARRLLHETAQRMVGNTSIVRLNDEEGFVPLHAVLDDAIINAALKA